jgi:hypothetical protein
MCTSADGDQGSISDGESSAKDTAAEKQAAAEKAAAETAAAEKAAAEKAAAEKAASEEKLKTASKKATTDRQEAEKAFVDANCQATDDGKETDEGSSGGTDGTKGAATDYCKELGAPEFCPCETTEMGVSLKCSTAKALNKNLAPGLPKFPDAHFTVLVDLCAEPAVMAMGYDVEGSDPFKEVIKVQNSIVKIPIPPLSIGIASVSALIGFSLNDGKLGITIGLDACVTGGYVRSAKFTTQFALCDDKRMILVCDHF